MWPEDGGPWRFRIGGWALPVEHGRWRATAPTTATRDDGVATAVVGVRGLPVPGIAHRSGGDPFDSGSATPWAAGATPAGEGDVVAALVAIGAQETLDLDAVPAVEVEAGRIVVRWRDGVVDVGPSGEGRA